MNAVTKLENQSQKYLDSVPVETVSCGCCGSDVNRVLYSAPQHNIYRNCAIVECTNCGVVRTSPRPTAQELAETYENEYYSYQAPNLEGLGNKIKILAMQQSNPILYPYVIPFKVQSDSVICDVGCGSGQWLGLMRKAYPTAKLHGFEISEETAKVARGVANADVRSGDFFDNGWESSTFDFITFWDVLEHVPDPTKVLREVERLLKPNGIAVIIVPNFNCFYSKVFKQFWWALLYDQHLHHFAPKPIDQLVRSVNLEPIYAGTPLTHSHPHWNIDNYRKELIHRGHGNIIQTSLLKLGESLISPLDKVQLTRILPQHLIICAKKRASELVKQDQLDDEYD